MANRQITAFDARATLHRCGLTGNEDFHALPSDRVQRLLVAANDRGYRQPPHANGSRARYFFAYLIRRAYLTRRAGL